MNNLSAFLSWFGSFAGQTLQTTPIELYRSFQDLYYGHKSGRALWCLLFSLAGAGGLATLFALEPAFADYFEPILFNILQSSGPSAQGFSQFVIGTVGGLIGLTVGHNTAKQIAQKYTSTFLGHSNPAYIYTNADLEKIIDANPQYFPLNGSTAAEKADQKAKDVATLAVLLQNVRDKIDETRDDDRPTHDRYKNALLNALRLQDLTPLIKLFASKDAENAVMKALSTGIADYLTGIPGFLAQPAANPNPTNINPQQLQGLVQNAVAAAPQITSLLAALHGALQHPSLQQGTEILHQAMADQPQLANVLQSLLAVGQNPPAQQSAASAAPVAGTRNLQVPLVTSRDTQGHEAMQEVFNDIEMQFQSAGSFGSVIYRSFQARIADLVSQNRDPRRVRPRTKSNEHDLALGGHEKSSWLAQLELTLNKHHQEQTDIRGLTERLFNGGKVKLR